MENILPLNFCYILLQLLKIWIDNKLERFFAVTKCNKMENRQIILLQTATPHFVTKCLFCYKVLHQILAF
jgi:ribosomal protein S27E